MTSGYRGRLAPSPTGFLHLGHARTFWIARERCCARQGTLILRTEDLDRARCRPEFVSAMIEDLRWFGFDWQEGPDCGGPFGPYVQSQRISIYRAAIERLRSAGAIYPCVCSRQDVLRALNAPHSGEEDPVYPGTCRPDEGGDGLNRVGRGVAGATPGARQPVSAARVNWRFRVPHGQTISFVDGRCGAQHFIAGRDFGDFVVWRHDDAPSYEFAVVVDDAAMQITEVVRGEDLLKSTARQLLVYRALGIDPPGFYHCPLLRDEAGIRLAKRHDALSLRTLRERGTVPAQLREQGKQFREGL